MIKEALYSIREEIEGICKKTNRNIADIKIIAVSKNTGINLINQAIVEGIKDLGESKAQELSEKAPLIDQNISWHFIGHLQTNKAKYAAEIADYIHSVDSIKLAEELNIQAAKRNRKLNILIEVNTSGEVNKYGVTELTDLLQLADFCQTTSNLDLVGLMTMAPYIAEEKIIRKCFSDLRKLRSTLNEEGYNITELSMGMSGDYRIAIEEGSTMIRLGTAIFGERDYSKSWKEQ